MAAGAWTIYDGFQRVLGEGTLNLSTGTFDIHFYTSASNASTSSLSTYSELTNQVAAAGGYTASGKQLSNPTWTSAAAGTMRFDIDDKILTASGSDITNIKYAVIVARLSGGTSATNAANHVLAWSTLTSSQFTLTSGSTLTITMNANGVFQMTS